MNVVIETDCLLLRTFTEDDAFSSLWTCLYPIWFTGLNLQKITGRALTGNLVSIKVLEKCGMKFLAEEYVHGHLHKTYQATNPTIKA